MERDAWIKSLRKDIRIFNTELNLIPDHILLLAFNVGKYDRYEYIGDAVLHMIVTDEMLNDIDFTAGDMTYIRGIVESNKSLSCMMNVRGICKYISGKIKEKTCADVFEAILGVLYVYLKGKPFGSVPTYPTHPTSTQGKDMSPIDILHRWMNKEWGLNILIDNAVDDKTVCESVKDMNMYSPVRYSPWSKWSPCNEEALSSRSRRCIRGSCYPEDLIETKTCIPYNPISEGMNPEDISKTFPWEYKDWSEWSPCNGEAFQTRRRECVSNSLLCQDEIETRECLTPWSKCDQNGNKYREHMFSGLIDKEVCPDSLYEEKTYTDSTCKDGFFHIKRKCKDSSLCTDIILQDIPCSEGDRFVSIPEFRKMSREEQYRTLLKELSIIRNQGISEKEISKIISGINPEMSKIKMRQSHIDLFNLLKTL